MSELTLPIFLSWSGALSKEIAKVIHEWLPSVIQTVEPFMSSEDIDKGTKWSDEIAAKLKNSGFGIIILTEENLSAPWVLFEAGALSNIVGRANVAPLLTNISVTQIRPPLNQFQSTEFKKEDFWKLIKAIAKSCDNSPKESSIKTVFEALWPGLSTAIENLVNEYHESKISDNSKITMDDLNLSMGEVVKVLQSLRSDIRYQRHARQIPSAVIRDLDDVFQALDESRNQNDGIQMDDLESKDVLTAFERVLHYLKLSREGRALRMHDSKRAFD